MKEFCMKDKRWGDVIGGQISYHYPEKHIKEFIKIIEQKVLTDWKGQNEFVDWLKNRAGDLG